MSARVLAFAGSTRTDSLNKKLLAHAAGVLAERGPEVSVVDLREFPMAVYDGDDEARDGVPEPARRLKALMVEHAGLLLATPEYNSSIPGGLKNAIDWVSRPTPGQARGSQPAFRGKVVGLLSASPGRLGGLRGLYHVREIFSNLGAFVVPTLVAVPGANEAFDEAGTLTEPAAVRQIETFADQFAQVLARLSVEQ